MLNLFGALPFVNLRLKLYFLLKYYNLNSLTSPSCFPHPSTSSNSYFTIKIVATNNLVVFRRFNSNIATDRFI